MKRGNSKSEGKGSEGKFVKLGKEERGRKGNDRVGSGVGRVSRGIYDHEYTQELFQREKTATREEIATNC